MAAIRNLQKSTEPFKPHNMTSIPNGQSRIINPSCLGEFDRPKVGEFEVANGALSEEMLNRHPLRQAETKANLDK